MFQKNGKYIKIEHWQIKINKLLKNVVIDGILKSIIILVLLIKLTMMKILSQCI